MAFWIFMLVMDLLIPVTMMALGRYFVKRAPKEINMIFGYRTSMSMKNRDTWEFAHHHVGKIWYITGLIFLVVTVIIFLCIISKPQDAIEKVGEIVCILQVVLLIASIIPTEVALHKTFDKNGNRKI